METAENPPSDPLDVGETVLPGSLSSDIMISFTADFGGAGRRRVELPCRYELLLPGASYADLGAAIERLWRARQASWGTLAGSFGDDHA